MAESTVVYKCPNCDAGLLFDAEKQKFICEFCISEFTEAELADTSWLSFEEGYALLKKIVSEGLSRVL